MTNLKILFLLKHIYAAAPRNVERQLLEIQSNEGNKLKTTFVADPDRHKDLEPQRKMLKQSAEKIILNTYCKRHNFS